MIKTTCLINSFNYKNYVGEAIESALSQTHPFDEIIVVDDASSDGSGDFLQSEYEQNPNVKIIVHEKNKGQLEAVTTGFLQSTGDIIFFLDADDIYHPQYLETALKIYSDNYNCDFLFCKMGCFQFSQENYTPPSQLQFSHYKDYVQNRGYSAILTLEEYAFVGSPNSGNSIRREYLREILPCTCIGGYRMWTDNCVLFGSSILGARKFFIDLPLVGYRRHSENESNNSFYLDRFKYYQSQFATIRFFTFMIEKANLDSLQISRLAPYEFKTIDNPTWELFFTYLKIMLRNPSSVPLVSPWIPSKFYGFAIMLKHMLKTSKRSI
ncbi:glycosyltransferase family 2 protein [Pseudanabaena sp. 'Roaring Creek']|uniref:glycosyltransferase family 2 protein n=1 Tax=Pseudanabaena sp. 'Roaring Creek' TaxID=1681830 RepID=UPI0006D768A8|nr:glycosyltransferase family 2 protein [Pseudanabaena sp. 'Roaring Creek']